MATTYTEGTTIGDFLRFYNSKVSIEQIQVDQNQALVMGEVVGRGTGGRIVAAAAPADEVQTIGITGTLTAGTFTLTFVDQAGALKTTDPIAYNANTAGIQTGVDSALGANAVTVAGTAITAMTFTFDGIEYSGLPQTLIEVDTQGLTGEEDTTVTRTTAGGGGIVAAVDCVQTIALTATAGTYTIKAYDHTGTLQETAAIAYNGDLAAVQTALDAKFGTNGIVAGGTAPTAMTLTFSGDGYEGRPQPDVDLGVASLTYSALTITHTTKGSPEMSGDVCGICAAALTNGAGAYASTIFVMRDAKVVDQYLTWGNANKVDAIAKLRGLGILVESDVTRVGAAHSTLVNN